MGGPWPGTRSEQESRPPSTRAVLAFPRGALVLSLPKPSPILLVLSAPADPALHPQWAQGDGTRAVPKTDGVFS